MRHSGQTRWSKLDNAAKIFPPTSDRRDTKVFRFSCELTEPIDPNILQSALNKTLDNFPFFRSIMKKGLFWYYLEDSVLPALVHEENRRPCDVMYTGDRKNLLFDVSFFGKRINLEIYHALTDGTGALNFLREMISHYLNQKYSSCFEGNLPHIEYDASESQRRDDSFYKYYNSKNKPKRRRSKRAYHLKGEWCSYNSMVAIEGHISVKKLLEAAHEKNVTLTAYLIALLIRAIHTEMAVRDMSRPIVVTVPVNLRKYFDSKSARNFFGIIDVVYDFSKQNDSFDDIAQYIGDMLKRELVPEKLNEQLNRLVALENNYAARVAPVVIKDPSMRFAYYLSEKGTTAAFSNIGQIQMPPEYHQFIEHFGVMTSTKRLQACMCSFKDDFVITFTSPFINHDVECAFFRALTSEGIDVKIVANMNEDDGT